MRKKNRVKVQALEKEKEIIGISNKQRENRSTKPFIKQPCQKKEPFIKQISSKNGVVG